MSTTPVFGCGCSQCNPPHERYENGNRIINCAPVTPGLFEYIMAVKPREMDKQANQEAITLWMLASAWGHLPAEQLLQIAKGELVPHYVGHQVHFTQKDTT